MSEPYYPRPEEKLRGAIRVADQWREKATDLQARVAELEAEIEKLREQYEDAASNLYHLSQRAQKAEADLADAKEDRANAEAHAAELLRRLADRDRLESALRDIMLRKATIATLDEARQHARAALEGSAE